MDQIAQGYFSPEAPGLFQPISEYFLMHNDPYMILADIESYLNCHDQVAKEFQDTETWTRKSILNTTNMGFFSSDRSVAEYAKDIWGIDPEKPLTVPARLANQES